VSKNWVHPKDEKGGHIPIRRGSLKENIAAWEEGAEQWRKGIACCGKHRIKKSELFLVGTYEEFAGPRPSECQGSYMPDWPEAEKTHYQMYETVSDGRPVSPVMESEEALARWLADNRTPAFADMPASYKEWLSAIVRGSAPSCYVISGTVVSGVKGDKSC